VTLVPKAVKPGSPEWSTAYWHRAMIYSQMGQNDKAERDYRAAEKKIFARRRRLPTPPQLRRDRRLFLRQHAACCKKKARPKQRLNCCKRRRNDGKKHRRKKAAGYRYADPGHPSQRRALLHSFSPER